VSDQNQMIQQLADPLARAKGWMQFLAILTILNGVLVALTIVGLIIAWLPIWVGVVLWQAAGAADEAQRTGDEQAMRRALEKVKLYFTIMGVLTLIVLLAMGVAMFTGMMAGIMGAAGM